MIFTKKMKKLFITSAVLAVIGLGLCLAGFFSAKASGESILSQTQNDEGQYVYTYEFDADFLKKISLDLSYADVNVMADDGEGRIELINYPLNNFSMTVGATTLSVEEKSTLSGIFSFNFDGFRNYFSSVMMASKNRSVNIYLPKGSSIKLFDFDIYSGDIIFSGISAETDFNLNVEYGTVALDGVSKAGDAALKISEGNLRIRNSELISLSADIDLGYTWISGSEINDIKTDIATGYFKLEGGEDLLSRVVRLKSEDGRVRFGGDIYENGSFSQGMIYTGVSGVVQKIIEVNVVKGNIMITQ